MQNLDWAVLLGTIVFITVYGIWKTVKNQQNTQDYLLSRRMKWYTVGLSVMATQASAITFLSTPGQAFSDGMRFVQFYFGLPFAMIVLCVTIVPLFYRLKVYTAYEYLEQRFDLKTRSLGALLFLTQRGLAAGLTIFAPALILSSVLGWDIYWTNIALGGVVVLYTVLGGTEAVSITQTQQMAVIFVGMVLAGIMVFKLMPAEVGFIEAIQVADQMGKMNAIDWTFDLNSRYNVWSGLIGGFFLSLSYFGTDQSQVQRYLGGKSIHESRLGLIMNGVVKVPMQFMILFVGVMVFVFYQFNPQPLFFNEVEVKKLGQNEILQFQGLEKQYNTIFEQKKQQSIDLVQALKEKQPHLVQEKTQILQKTEKEYAEIKKQALSLIHAQNAAEGKPKASDTNYVFLTFVMNYLPSGIIGLLIAVILSASMSSTASELNALASTTVIDIYKRNIKPNASEKHYLQVSKIATVAWGMYAILLAEFANQLSNNLIEAVNILGSLFYGTILGIFLVAFYVPKIKGNAVFAAAVCAELVVVALWYAGEVLKIPEFQISYLWFNLIGCALVAGLGAIFQVFFRKISL